MGDSGLSQEQASQNYDLCAFYTMWALNIQDSQVRAGGRACLVPQMLMRPAGCRLLVPPPPAGWCGSSRVW